MNRRVSPMLEVARGWWKRDLAKLDLASRITKDDEVEDFTVYEIGHQMPDLSGQPNRWRITTARQTMKSRHFSADDRGAIKRAHNKGKGRALYAMDLVGLDLARALGRGVRLGVIDDGAADLCQGHLLEVLSKAKDGRRR